MASYLVGVDIGGTFTDCVAVDDQGRVTTAKAPSTPADFSLGVLHALAGVASELGLSAAELCQATRLFSHGTTAGTNAIIQGTGARVGLLTTKGHTDVLHIMRGSRGLTGRELRKVVHFPESSKPDPIVPKRLIEGVSERIDCKGVVVVPLNEDQAATAIKKLLEQDVEAVAICFLWSFLNSAHEMRVKEMIADFAPDLFVVASSELAPKWGEYERATAAVLDAYIGPLTVRYLKRLEAQLKELGLKNPIQIAQCGGGTVSIDTAVKAPLLTLHSGPVAGVSGSRFVGDRMGHRHIITTDMGGTSFDVGMIYDGAPATSHTSLVNQYEYFLPTVSIETIGSGGGSLVTVDPATRTLRVGPESAGADPGPICYDLGGTVPTLTDAALVLGYVCPDGFAGGRMKLNLGAAQQAIADIAAQVDLSPLECAAGIVRIAEFQMADLIRRTTVQRGFDPREFVLYAFGGAGPLFASSFAFEVGVEKVLVPQRKLASSWCAYGAASADVLHIIEISDIVASPLPLERINAHLAQLLADGQRRLTRDGIGEADQQFQFSIDMRHRGQINEVEVALAGDQLDDAARDRLYEDFYARYEQLYGLGSSFRGAQLEAVTYRVRAMAEGQKPTLACVEATTDDYPAGAAKGERQIYWSDLGQTVATPIYDGQRLVPGNRVAGPAVLETPDTSVVVAPGCAAMIDAFNNFSIVKSPDPASGSGKDADHD